ncbi:MAG: Cu(I)-responsive transcriptional regulator [Rubrivivax sp.]|nr:Cu(I)-responsive transcriptional regulator [Rubrivivax sp.]
MNIGRAASASGVSPKMIRHYESVRLLEPAPRSDAGYRHYNERDVQTLRFVRHARNLGFSIDQIRELLGLWRDQARPSRDVKALTMAHIATLEGKEAELRAMRSALEHLAHACQGDDRPACPILDGLTDEQAAAGVEPEALLACSRHSLPPPRRRHDLMAQGQ